MTVQRGVASIFNENVADNFTFPLITIHGLGSLIKEKKFLFESSKCRDSDELLGVWVRIPSWESSRSEFELYSVLSCHLKYFIPIFFRIYRNSFPS